MTNPPTPDEIAEALATLHRMPYVRADTTLAEIKGANTPFWWMVRDILGQLDSDRLPNPGELASILATSAAAHGLRITADPEPGQLVGYQHLDVIGVQPYDASADDVRHADAGIWYGPTVNGRRNALSDAGNDYRTGAVYLLPEGGKA